VVLAWLDGVAAWAADEVLDDDDVDGVVVEVDDEDVDDDDADDDADDDDVEGVVVDVVTRPEAAMAALFLLAADTAMHPVRAIIPAALAAPVMRRARLAAWRFGRRGGGLAGGWTRGDMLTPRRLRLEWGRGR